jgi:predicted GIY-YIG superfamily endonuclease
MRLSVKSIVLYRPTGPKELDLIKKSGYKKFPPRLPEQPIFYPVLTKEYAIKIARDWNVKASGIGYVLEFKVKKDFLVKYPVQIAGGNSHQEYWIPAEELEDFNQALVGEIKVIQTFQKWYVYILKCSDNTLYTGITNNLDKRIKQHNEGKGAKYTRGRGPVALVKSFECQTKSEALKLEYQIKQLPKNDKLNFQG